MCHHVCCVCVVAAAVAVTVCCRRADAVLWCAVQLTHADHAENPYFQKDFCTLCTTCHFHLVFFAFSVICVWFLHISATNTRNGAKRTPHVTEKHAPAFELVCAGAGCGGCQNRGCLPKHRDNAKLISSLSVFDTNRVIFGSMCFKWRRLIRGRSWRHSRATTRNRLPTRPQKCFFFLKKKSGCGVPGRLECYDRMLSPEMFMKITRVSACSQNFIVER